jgi:methionyl-tRNA formyltransferase
MAYDIPYILFGSPPIGDIAAKILQQSEYPPAAVIDDTKLTLEEQLDLVQKHQAGFILVVGYGRILKQDLLDSVAGQVLNIHPSLLPQYRGPAPVVQAILDGVTETGVSLMELDREMDHGPLLAQTSYIMHSKETPDELYQLLTYKGVQLFLDTIEAYLEETLPLQKQDDEEATYTHMIKKEEGLLDLNKPAEELERQIRAFQGWPGSWVMRKGKRLIVHKAHIQSNQLLFDEVQPEGGKRMTLAAYCAGQRITPEELYKELHTSP